MRIDNVAFNVEAIKRMNEDEFIRLHSHLKSEMEPEIRTKWLKMAYGRITGRKPARETKENA